MVGRVVGRNGENISKVKKTFDVSMTVNNNTVTLRGKRDNVFNAEKYLVICLENQSFTAKLNKSYSGFIIGKKGERIAKIRNKSKAHVKISTLPNGKDYLLEVAGEQEQYKCAMKMIMDAIREKVNEDFKKEDEQCLFQTKDLQEEKKYEARIVLDQEEFSPAHFYLNFIDNDERIEVFHPFKDLESNKPPKAISRNCAILAPYGGLLYRAKPIGIRTSEDETKIELKVKFMDYGNIVIVDLMKCKDCPPKHLYPPRATAVRLWNLKGENWSVESLQTFRQLLVNNGDKTFEAKIMSKAIESDGTISVSLWIPGIGDVCNHLVGMQFGSWIDDPFSPLKQSIVAVSCVGSTQMLFVQNKVGSTVTIDVSSTSSNKGEEYSFGANFNTPLFKDSINASYIASKKLLESRKCFYLSGNKLFFGTKNVGNQVQEYFGKSGGLALCVCILIS